MKIYKLLRENLLVKASFNLVMNNGVEFAGYLAFLSILSIFPFTFIIISSISMIDQTAAGIKLINEFFSYMPDYLLDILKPQINDFLNGPPTKLLSLMFVGAIWTSSSSVEALKQMFNKIYQVENPPNFIISRVFSIIQFLCAVTIIILSMFCLIVLPKIFLYVEGQFNVLMPSLGNEFTRFLFLSAIMFVVISSIFYSLTSSKEITFKSTIPGSILVLIIWYGSGNLLGFYVNNFSQFSLTYGSLASIIIVLFFFYIVNFALLYGAEVNYLLSKKR